MKLLKVTALAVALILPALGAFAEGDLVKVGDKAPEFTAVDTAGAQVSLAQFKGKVVLLNFFATWCGPCMQEMPHLEKEVWQAMKGDGLVVLAVGREHSVEELLAFKAKKGFSFAILADPKREVYAKYASSYIPRCYLIGKDGVVKFASVGFEAKEFEQLLSSAKAELRK